MLRCLALVLLLPASASADGAFAQTEAFTTLWSEAGDRTRLVRTFGAALKAGYRWGRWGAFGQAEAALWFNPVDEDTDELQGVANLGVGGEALYFDGFLRTSLALGASVLMIGNNIDEAGETGVFLDLRPIGLRWSLGDGYVIGVDPLSFALVMPVLSGIPLVELQYRTTLFGELSF